MDRIQGSTATTDHKFTEGNPSTAVPATIVSASWLNGVQEELIAILTAAGIKPDAAVLNQVHAALDASYAPKTNTATRLGDLETAATDADTRLDAIEPKVALPAGFGITEFSSITVHDNSWTQLVTFTIPAQAAGHTYQLGLEMHMNGSTSADGLVMLLRLRTNEIGETATASAPSFAHEDGTVSIGASIAGLSVSSGSVAKIVTAECLIRGGTISGARGEVVVRKISGS